MAAAPDFVTHYYRRSRAPFLNLSDLSEEEVMAVMQAMIEERREGRQHRPFGRKYLEMRREAETRLRDLFGASGGRPERETPHYFVLGESPWFRGLAPDMAEIRLALADLPSDQTSITWGDSFGVTLVNRDFGLDYESRPYHGQLFRLGDIPDLVERFGFEVVQAGSYDGLAAGVPTTDNLEPFIEVQLWSDGPVQQYLAR